MSETRIQLWLDDVRTAPEGWLHVKTAQAARNAVLRAWFGEYPIPPGQSHDLEYYRTPDIEMSLDHDLGICHKCTPGVVAPGSNIVIMQTLEAICKTGCDCDCHESGYDFVCWLEERGLWPVNPPRVHSANPAGAARMRAAIRRYYDSVTR